MGRIANDASTGCSDLGHSNRVARVEIQENLCGPRRSHTGLTGCDFVASAPRPDLGNQTAVYGLGLKLEERLLVRSK